MKIVPLIMAGGAGTRLWPMSREDLPKQFHNLSGKGTLMEETIKRLVPLDADMAVIVTSLKYEDLSLNEIKKAGIRGAVLSEPRPRNTAAAVLYGALYLDALYDDSIMIVLPADHHILDADEFRNVLRIGIDEAEKENLVTIGIKPEYPETGYGYIKSAGKEGRAIEVDEFVEKPDLETARKYVESGNFFWNSGIFIWKTSVILNRFDELLPDHVKQFQPLRDLSSDDIASNSGDVWKLKEQIFDSLESVSIDNGILEHAERRVVIPGSFGWYDLGSWKSTDNILAPDENGNRSPGRERAVFADSKNCTVFSERKRVSILGLDNVIVVEAGDEILVLDKDSSQDVRKVVDIVKEKSR